MHDNVKVTTTVPPSQCHIPEHSILRLTAMRTSNLICICSTKNTWTYLKYKELQNSLYIYFTIKIHDFKIHSLRIHINIWREVTLSLKSMAQSFTCSLKNGSWSGGNIVLIYLLHLQLPASLLSSLGPQISENIIKNTEYNRKYKTSYCNSQGEERETNKMQLIWCLLSNFYLNMFRASLCPSSGEQECALPHMVFCTVTRGEQNRKMWEP